MFTSYNLFLGLLAITITGSILYRQAKKRGAIVVITLIPTLLSVYALINILIAFFLWINHITFPLNLEAMELTILEHLKRIMTGQLIYVEPTPEFVALAYNPLYYYLAVPFAWIFGVNLFSLRLVAILGTFGVGLIIFLAIYRKTGSYWWSLMAVGLFAAGYQVMDAYLDNAHADSWLLFTILLGCYLIDLNRSRLTELAGVLLIVISFWFKQPGAIFAIGAILFLTWREGWRQSWPFWFVAIFLGPVLYLAIPDWLLGARFHYFTFEVPRQWTVFDTSTIRRLASMIIKSYSVLAIVGFITCSSSLWKLRSKGGIWCFLFPFAIFSGLLGSLDPESNNNVFIPMGVWFIITGILGLSQLTRYYKPVEQWGVHIFALGVSFALFLYNPFPLVVSPQANSRYQEFVAYLESLDGPVYAPWLGQLPDQYQFYPAAHWVPMTDLVRQAGLEELDSIQNEANCRTLLEPVLSPKQQAYVLTNYPLEHDVALAFLTEKYVLDTDLGDRFSLLGTLPRRYYLGWPRYLYRYDPEKTAAQAVDSP